MNPPKVYEETRPRSQRMTRTMAIVSSMADGVRKGSASLVPRAPAFITGFTGVTYFHARRGNFFGREQNAASDRQSLANCAIQYGSTPHKTGTDSLKY